MQAEMKRQPVESTFSISPLTFFSPLVIVHKPSKYLFQDAHTSIQHIFEGKKSPIPLACANENAWRTQEHKPSKVFLLNSASKAFSTKTP
jgi:hypothetical protein